MMETNIYDPNLKALFNLKAEFIEITNKNPTDFYNIKIIVESIYNILSNNPNLNNFDYSFMDKALKLLKKDNYKKDSVICRQLNDILIKFYCLRYELISNYIKN